MALTLLSMLFWGAQPLGIAVLRGMPASALSFYKIFSAAISLALFLALTGQFPHFGKISRGTLLLLATAAASLGVSYVLYNASFRFVSPTNVQVYYQASRIFLALGGIFFFRESFTRLQWTGLATLCLGLALFFHNQLSLSEHYALGVGMVIVSALTWAAYAMCQKYLLPRVAPLGVLLFVYIALSLALAPFARLAPLGALPFPQWLALTFVCITNVMAFGCFSLSLKHWDSSKIGALSCLTPLLTMALMAVLAGTILPGVAPESLGIVAILGALLAISGTGVVAFFGKRVPG
ncbi:MAG: DMT family transporter [Bdellovibrionota bacterium]